jgi:hypothetical protein
MRYALAGVLLPLLLSGGPVETGPEMNVQRAAHTATLLTSGKVLLAGGCTEHSCELSTDGATTELYDPRTHRFERGPRMTRPRVSHTATRLPNGDVLIAGGWDGPRVTATAELYEAATRRFASVASTRHARGGAVAAHIGGGRVLIAGGSGRNGVLRSAEIFNPRTRSFAPARSMLAARGGHSAARLTGGKVLVTGGADQSGRVLRSAELFDPRTLRFTRVGQMAIPRHKHASVALPGGGALILGGSDERDFRGRYASVEYFQAKSRAFRRLGPMVRARFKLDGTAVALRPGIVLVAGGAEDVEVYNIKRRRSGRIGTTGARLAFATATVLLDGTILFVGGYDDDIEVSRRAWLIRA